MSAILLSLSDRQTMETQRRAIAAVQQQRERDRRRWSLDELLASGQVEPGIVGHPSLDAWYRAQPVAPGRVAPKLSMQREEKRLYGLPVSARLVDLRGLGPELGHCAVIVTPILGGWVAGVKAPGKAGGVGVLWRKSHKASDYALRLSAEYGLPHHEVWS